MYGVVLCILVVTGVANGLKTIDDTCPSALRGRVDVYYLDVQGDSCFYFGLTERKTYYSARKDCENDGGTLAMPKTKSLNDFLKDRLVNHYGTGEQTWIGLNDKKNESVFMWADNSKMNWNNFAPGNGPNNIWFVRDLEDCVVLSPQNDGLWHDYQCNSDLLSWISLTNPSKLYICQYTFDNDD
ncbi:hypothetical protein RRG08_063320 [Elysia crispata]|uniref:C-type lectin domain-containing protein n=1 Tax=Elysia crispata TaxID=231223 RepID=A0AAE0ZX66_9GAST|nr:hypothetical protein RRG08_063320 [Elysia crispata]